MAKSTENYGFGHIYWRNPYWKSPIIVQCGKEAMPAVIESIPLKIILRKLNLGDFDTPKGKKKLYF